MVLSTIINNIEGNREKYLVMFIVVLIISIISTLLIYYFVRYKKKYFFDAAGRKFIVSTGQFPNIINRLIETIQFDNINKLRDLVIKNSIAFLQVRNDKNQNLLHLCSIYGAKECLVYVKNFNILNPNEKDGSGNIPLYYLIRNNSEDNQKNKEMFLWLCKGVDVDSICEDGETVKAKLNPWQSGLLNKYGKTSLSKV